jgi:hypothetical protein
MTSFRKAAPWLSRVIILLSLGIFVMIAIQPFFHPAANALSQGIAFTSPAGATFFRVSFAGFPIGCAAFLVYCLVSSRRSLTGLIFSTLILGILLAVRIYGMEVDSTVEQSLPLVKPEIVLVVLTLLGIVIETRYGSHARSTTATQIAPTRA